MPRWGQQRALLAMIAAIGVLVAGCSASSSQQTSSPRTNHPRASGGACQVTDPGGHDIPAPLKRYGDGPFFGDGQMWIDAWWTKNGNVGTSGNKDYPYGVKYASFTLRHGKVTGALGRPKIEAIRLDGSGLAKGSFGGYATATSNGVIQHWWPTGLIFSSHGCWQITESVGHSTIKFIVRI